jgi:hypothetical protein
MKNKRNLILAVFGLALVAVSVHHLHLGALALLACVPLFGVTVNYFWPTTNIQIPGSPLLGTNPPTNAQDASLVVVEVAMGDADTQAVITHNLQISVNDQASDFPRVSAIRIGAGTNPSSTTYSIPKGGPGVANTITLNKLSTATGSNFTDRVYISIPNTLER